MKVNLSEVPETLFITLRVQAAETAKPNSSTRAPYTIEVRPTFIEIRRESHEIKDTCINRHTVYRMQLTSCTSADRKIKRSHHRCQ